MSVDISEESVQETNTLPGTSIEKRIILIVEDDIEDQHILLKAFDIFITKGLEIHFVKDGVAAMNFLADNKGTAIVPRLIVVDLNMPKLSGMEMLQRVKGDEFLKNIPVIVFSSSSNPLDIEESKKQGASDYFTKPSTFGQYKEIAEKFVSYM